MGYVHILLIIKNATFFNKKNRTNVFLFNKFFTTLQSEN
jgi:hypothetical protein